MKIRYRLQLMAAICAAAIFVCGVCYHLLPVKVTLDGNIEEMRIEMGSPVHGRHHFTVTDADDISPLESSPNLCVKCIRQILETRKSALDWNGKWPRQGSCRQRQLP